METFECDVCKRNLEYNFFVKPILINKSKICKNCNYLIFLKKKLKEIVLKQFKEDKKLEIEKKEQEKKIITERKAKYLARQKEYRINNKEKYKVKHKCDCGGRYSLLTKSVHLKTKRHIRYEKNKNKS